MTQPKDGQRKAQRLARESEVRELDLRGLLCPLTWARTRYALESLVSGNELRVLVDYRPAVPDIKRNAEELGHEVLSSHQEPLLGKHVWALHLRRS